MDNIHPYILHTAMSKRNNFKNKTSPQHQHSDSGVVSDMEYMKSTMSSSESDKCNNRLQSSWNSSNYSFSDSMPSCGGRDYSTGGSSRSTGSTSSSSSSRFDHESAYSQDSTLPELSQVPWTEGDILSTLQKGELKESCGNISIECLQRLSYLLQRPLVRIAREAQRLSEMHNKCSKHDIRSAAKIILSPHMYKETNTFASQNTLLYSMSTKDMKSSKSSLCSLSLSVGKHHRWLIEAMSVGYVHELAAVYLAAMMETIVEQTARLAFLHNSKAASTESSVITTDMLEAGIQRFPDLHSLFNPSSHLIGYSYPDISSTRTHSSSKSMSAERNLLTCSCSSSVSELTDIVSQAMHYWYPKLTNGSQTKWSSSAINTLYYFTKCSQPNCYEAVCSLIPLKAERSHLNVPPVIEWVRTSVAFAEHRNADIVDSDDIRQTARLLLPNADCPIRSNSELLSANMESGSAVDAQRNFALQLFTSGVPELKKYACTLLTKSDIDHTNQQGMTPLMCACARGDDVTVLSLLRLSASTEVSVPSTHHSCPGWTALCYAVSKGHLSIVKLLLEHGCAADGSASQDGNCSETPLQIACAAGEIEIVHLLLQYGADPYQQTLLQPGVEIKNSFNSFTLAASHGHRETLRRLFAESLRLKSYKLLTLSEMLAETSAEKICPDRPGNGQSQVKEENEYMVIENDYVTIEDVSRICKFSQLKEKLSSFYIDILQDSMYQAAENGYLDLTLEIHSTGLPWTTYTWFMALNAAHIMHRRPIVQSLLKDFDSINQMDNVKQFTEYCLPLMFDIFRESKNEMISRQLAVIFSLLYGPQPLPLLKDVRTHPSPIIESSYVNSAELADVSFIVEKKTFYAHKIILSSASPTFKSMLSNFSNVAMPNIEIRDIDYDTFEGVMRYVYEGYDCTRLLKQTDAKAVRHLLGAAHYFQLDGLKRKCEIYLSKNLSLENCVSVYKTAKLNTCIDLVEICEAYFLQNLNRLLTKSETFKRILYSVKVHNRELLNRLYSTLTTRLSSKISSTCQQ